MLDRNSDVFDLLHLLWSFVALVIGLKRAVVRCRLWLGLQLRVAADEAAVLLVAGELVIHFVAAEGAVVVTFLLLHDGVGLLIVRLLDLGARGHVDARRFQEASYAPLMDTLGMAAALMLAIAELALHMQLIQPARVSMLWNLPVCLDII